MAKGKQFNAAEKHFEEKCVVWRQKIRDLEHQNSEFARMVVAANRERDKALAEAAKLREQNEALMKLKDMSPEDVKTLLKSKEAANRLDEMFGVLVRVGRY